MFAHKEEDVGVFDWNHYLSEVLGGSNMLQPNIYILYFVGDNPMLSQYIPSLDKRTGLSIWHKKVKNKHMNIRYKYRDYL